MLNPARSPNPKTWSISGQKRFAIHSVSASNDSAAQKEEGLADELRKPFKFRHFSIYQDRCAMKVGTDAMLLGSWAPPPRPPPARPSAGQRSGDAVDNCCRILDVGTGTGVLALMMAQKTAAAEATTAAAATAAATAPAASAAAAATGCCIGGVAPAAADTVSADAAAPGGGGGGGGGARIVAIDVDPGACAQAAENAARSPWGRRIRVLQCSLQQLAAAAAAGMAAATAAAGMAAATAAPAPTRHTAGGPAGDLNDGSAAESTSAWASASAASAAAAAAACGVRGVSSPAGAATGPGPGPGLQGFGAAAEDLGPFDLIISNPPYFVESSKPASGRTARASARHADVSLPFSDLAAGCEALLAPGGSVCLVLPPTEAQRFRDAAAACGLVMVELVRVFTASEDDRERRHLMRLQRAADLPYSGAEETTSDLPYTSTLVISGPMQQQHLRQGRVAAAAGASGSDSNSTAGGGPAVVSRRYTAAYLALTTGFHDPAVIAQHSHAADADASSYTVGS
ncbi:hypothetical protein PLESTM_000083500 [Pleodorina starrii]|nr:hypothetical protein PLESTM_000083500 [Pleodorina starrii]